MKTIISKKPNSRMVSDATMSLKMDRPGEEEGDFQVEQDEDDGDQVEAHVELHARILEGLEAAFERGKLFAVGPVRGDQPAEKDGGTPEGQADEYENEDRKVIFQHFVASHFTRYCRPVDPQGSSGLPALRFCIALLLCCQINWCRR
jgi:hypothetical protein